MYTHYTKSQVIFFSTIQNSISTFVRRRRRPRDLSTHVRLRKIDKTERRTIFFINYIAPTQNIGTSFGRGKKSVLLEFIDGRSYKSGHNGRVRKYRAYAYKYLQYRYSHVFKTICHYGNTLRYSRTHTHIFIRLYTRL